MGHNQSGLKWKTLTVPSADEDVEQLELAYIADGSLK